MPSDEGALEFGECAHDGEKKVRHRRIIAGEGEVFFQKLDANATLGEHLDDAAKVVKVAGEAVHAVDDHHIAFADEGEKGVKLRAAGVLAGGFIGEEAVEFNAVQLAVGILVGAADADIADALALHVHPSGVGLSGWSLRSPPADVD
jgi:hypothetical protein